MDSAVHAFVSRVTLRTHKTVKQARRKRMSMGRRFAFTVIPRFLELPAISSEKVIFPGFSLILSSFTLKITPLSRTLRLFKQFAVSLDQMLAYLDHPKRFDTTAYRK